MKKSRIAKLALMGASITALAATLTTSTYAWYVSNKTATVEKMDGATSAGTADGSILLSWDNSTDSYYKTLSWTDAKAPQNVVTGTTVGEVTTYAFTQKLDPLYYVAADSSFKFIESYAKADSYDSTKTYYTKSGTTYTEATVASAEAFAQGEYYLQKNSGAAKTTGFVRFSMYIKADADTTVTITPTMKNTTPSTVANSLKQIAYAPTGSVGQGESFLVDAFDAMYYSLNIDTSTTAAAVVAAPTSGKMAAANGAVKPGAAHSYYETVTGEDLLPAYEAEPVTTALSTLDLDADTPVKLTWTIWLAGNDVDCYNSCAGQSFSFELKFTA